MIIEHIDMLNKRNRRAASTRDRNGLPESDISLGLCWPHFAAVDKRYLKRYPLVSFPTAI